MLLTATCEPQAGVRKEAMLEIKRRCGRAKPVVYHVTDKPPPKKSQVRKRNAHATCRNDADRYHRATQDWARVVAVFVQGANWQFSDFPFKVRTWHRACVSVSVFVQAR